MQNSYSIDCPHCGNEMSVGVPLTVTKAVCTARKEGFTGCGQQFDIAQAIIAKLLTSEQVARPRVDLTLRQLQTQLPWTVHYHKDFRSSPMTHKDFGHALLHVLKAAGKLAAVVNDAEHGGSEFKPDEVDRFVADLVVCALRMSNTCPGRVIDLQRAVEDRIETKNDAELQRVKQ
jgi:hypothetical protein